MKPPGRSVRSRLTLAVTLIVAAVAVAAALVVPRIVRNALIDDLLDAEATETGVEQTFAFDAITFLTEGLDESELTDIYGPEIEDLATALDGTGALDELRSFRDDGLVVVVPAPGTIGTIDHDGTVVVEHATLDDAGPLVTTSELRSIAFDFDVEWFTFDPFEPFLTGDQTFEELIEGFEAIDPQQILEDFGLDLDEEGVIVSGPFDLELPFDESIAPFPGDDLPARPAPGGADAGADIELAYGIRSVDGIDLIVAAPTESVSRSVDRLTTTLLLLGPATILLVGIATWLIAGRALRPVGEITARTATIRGGALHERVPVPKSHDEIAELATEMNDMLFRLQQEDDRRRQFVSDASHELRSPIAAIQIQAEASLAVDPNPDTAELAAGVLAEAQRMGVVVADLLALARHDEGLAPPGELIDLDDIVLAEAARPRRVSVDTGAVSAGRVRGRAGELSRVVTHLLDNAARHAQSRVAISLTTDGDRVVLAIDDDGPGIPPEQRERVLERFVRLDEARERDHGGAGLGLAVVTSVVHAAGGRVTIDTSTLGGARVEIDLPAES